MARARRAMPENPAEQTSMVRVGTTARDRLREYCATRGLIMARMVTVAVDEFISRNANPRKLARRKGDKVA